MRAIRAAAAVSVLLLAAAGQAQALTVDHGARETSVERVELGQVNFRDQAQVDAAYRRLQQSAMFVCGVSAFNDRAEREASRACAEAALRDAVAKLDRPLLTAAHQQAGAPMLARGY